MSTTVGAHSGAGPLSLMSCVRESSPLQDYDPDIEKNVVSKRKFWNPKKWFRKKQKTSEDSAVHHQESRDGDGSRSRSTGELSTDEEPSRSNDVRKSANMHPGLSVSHDSVFHPLNSGSDLELDGAQSSSSLSISQPLGDAKLQTELSSRFRLRRGRGDTSEDDEGLPRSPPYGSPAAAADSFLIIEKTVHNKDLPTKSHSTCSDGSLLSMDSSEMDEDSVGLQSRHSSKVSLNEKRTEQESELELLGPSFSTVPLNHSAAHHRVSVRPKRTYGAPRRKKAQLSSALPATPEVNEDSSIRSISPESVTTEPITELYSSTRQYKTSLISHEVKLKCNSLPAGATPPTAESLRLLRSKSNAGKSRDDASLNGEEREEKLSLFERLFPRRSGKKKKKDEVKDKEAVQEARMEVDGDETKVKIFIESKSYSHTKREDAKPIVAPRVGAASRQRISPIDIPATPKEVRSPTSPCFSPGTSPIQLELESLLKQRQMLSVSPPKSPKQDIRSKIKIAGLSSLQQRVLNLNIEEPVKVNRPLSKSHSFKNQIEDSVEEHCAVTKAASLDSVKNLEAPPLMKSELTLTLKPAAARKCVKKEMEIEEIEVVAEKSPLKEFPSNIKEEVPKSFITISGPSHTAIVNVSSKSENEIVDHKKVSVTKIQLKHDGIPEFLNKQLNKVEVRPVSNVVCSMKSPKLSPEEAHVSKTLFNLLPRKFSKEDVEIIEKDSPTRLKKNDSKPPSSRKSSSVISPDSPKETALKARSISLDSLKSEEIPDKSSQDSLDKGVVLRRKSFVKQKNEEEPELMKVFARRSLKLKDSDVDQIQEKLSDERQRDSDKENNTETEEEEMKIKNVAKEEAEVQLRRGLNNNIFLATQRAISLNNSSTTTTDFHIKKQSSLSERRRTDQWITTKKDENDEIITSKVEEIRTETKNFSQRRAEWEKRVQQAQK